MIPVHPFHKHLCILFLSIALIASYISLKSKNNILENSFKFYNTSTEFEEYFKEIFDSNRSEQNNLRIVFDTFSPKHKNGSNHHIVHILGLFELSTKYGVRKQGLSEVSAAKLAVKHVNSFDVLPGYSLKLLINDTKCDPGVGIDAFFHSIYSKETIMMLLGTSCSNVTESLAHVVPYWNILQMSFGSTSPILSDRKKFPLFFRTVAPDSSHNAAKIQFIKHFGWKVVATFSQSENIFLLPLNNLITQLEKANVSCVATITFSLDNYKEQLKALKVFELKMFGTDYVWILQDQQSTWWDETNIDCSRTNLRKSIEGIILVSDFNMIPENKTSVSGLSNELFENEVNISDSQEISKYAKFTYDAIWAMALTLRESQSLSWGNSLRDFNYKRKDMVCNFVKKMSSLDFMGLSGPVKFLGADRIGNSALYQIQGGKMTQIAIFDSTKSFLNFKCKLCEKIIWHLGRTPIAQRVLKISLITIPKGLFYSIISVSILGISASLLFLYFNLHFRRVKSVKLSSPKLNNVAVIGCILVYSSVILLGFDEITLKSNNYFNELCTVRVYLLSAGFSLAFGSMFAKTYRVHRIFTYCGGTSKVKDKLLKDKQLIGLILIPLIIDAIILTLWVMIDPMQRQLHNLSLVINSQDRGVVFQPQVEVCRSQNTIGWFIAIYGYKGLILIMGVFMAWETRHVKVQALNDSQYIGICVYSAVFSAIIVVLSSFISEYVILSYLAKTISILTSTSITLCLLFLPKLKLVFNAKHVGNNHDHDPVMQSLGFKIECNTRRFATDDPKELIYRLEIQNRVYKCEIKALDQEISRLESLIFNNQSSSSASMDKSSGITQIEICVPPIEVWGSTGRASWPSPDSQFFFKPSERNCQFYSENKLSNNDSEKFWIFGKLKEIFGSIPLVIAKNEEIEAISKEIKEKPNSNPEFCNKKLPIQNNLVKAKSEISVIFK